MLNLSLFDLKKRIAALSDNPHAGIMVYTFYIQRAGPGFMVFESRSRGVWEFERDADAARFVIERILNAAGASGLELVG